MPSSTLKKLVCLLALAWPLACPPIRAQQKLPNAQQLEERLKKAEERLTTAETKAERAELLKERIEQAQKDSKDYYDKVLDHETRWLEVIAIIITLIPGFAAIFSFRVFQRQIQDATRKASQELSRTFEAKFETLREENAEKLGSLESSLAAEITRQVKNLRVMSAFSYHFSIGQSCLAAQTFPSAQRQFRDALKIYKENRAAITKRNGISCIDNLFNAIKGDSADEFLKNATEELRLPLYDDLEEELERAAENDEIAAIAPLIAMRPKKKPQSKPDAEDENS